MNHDGDLDRARRLVSAAKLAGADGVKFQTFAAERVASVDHVSEGPLEIAATAQLAATSPRHDSRRRIASQPWISATGRSGHA